MRKHRMVIVCFALLLCLCSVAYAAESFSDFRLKYLNLDTYYSIVSDTASKDMTAGDKNAHARLYVYENNASKNCIFRAYSSGYASGKYYCKTVNNRWMEYTKDISENSRVYLRGRTDSGETNTVYITGEFGAG